MSRPRDRSREHGLTEDRVAFLARHAPECGTCGKKCYPSRKLARAVARILYPGTRMRAYGCGEEFHVTSQDAGTAARERGLTR